MYDAGARDYFDALSAHAYGILAPIDEAPDPSRVNFRRIELLRDIMQRNGDGDKPVYITEAGWNDSPRWNQAVTPTQRIENTLKALEWVKDKDWIKALALWVFSYPQATRTFSDNWTFVTDDLRPKPIYDEVQKQLTMTNDK
jgi:hypothetical protein